MAIRRLLQFVLNLSNHIRYYYYYCSLYLGDDVMPVFFFLLESRLHPAALGLKNLSHYSLLLLLLLLLLVLLNAVRKEAKYEELSHRLNDEYDEVNFVNLSMGNIGVFGKSCNSFLTMMSSIGIGEKSSTYIIKTAANIALRYSYYIFCRRNKQWTEKSLLQL